MKIKYPGKEFPMWLMLLYPIIDVLYNYIAEELHYSTFNIAYFIIFVIAVFISHKYLMRKSTLLCILAFFMYAVLGYSKSGTILIQFFLFLIILNIFSHKKFINFLKNFIIKRWKVQLYICVGYIVIILLSIAFRNGIQNNWNTIILYGPFRLPHTFAYELLALLMISLYQYKQMNQKIWLVIAGVFELFIILTCVRSALLTSAIILFGFMLSYKLATKVYLITIGAIILGIFIYYNVFDQLIEKTLFAIGNGSITNGREWIVNSSISIFRESTILEKIFGSGYNNLLSENYRLLGSAIQGHNDLLTVLVSFGIVGLILYLYYFIKYLEKEGLQLCFLALFILVYFNGLFLYCPMVVSLGITKIFFEMAVTPKRNRAKGKDSIWKRIDH